MQSMRPEPTISTSTRAARLLQAFCADTRGATSIEYGLIAMLMAVACIAAFSNVGNSSGGGWGNMSNKVSANLK